MTKRKKAGRVFSFILILLLILGLGILGVYFMMVRSVKAEFGEPAANLSQTQRVLFTVELFVSRNALLDPQSLPGVEQNFIINQGESVGMICIRLEKAGLIPNAELMRTYLVYTGLDRMLQSGQFALTTAMSPVQVAAELLDATPKDAVVTILPGWRIEEVAANVAGSGLSISAEAFIQAAYSPTQQQLALLPVSDPGSLEGFLFPGTYVLPRESNLDDVLKVILSNFTAQIDETLLDGFERQNLSLLEAVNLAAIVEKEAVVADEKPLIASVFFNRFAYGMRLETDPTVQYALGFNQDTGSWWKAPLSLADLSVESPYNTYQNFGLPPGPICNPDLGSLRAVAFPAETPYFFFRAACDDSGRHNFAITFEEHLNNSCE
ncbi:MAG: endolytic transglycosylase MltG [Brevefilum sp.]|nr:endolytic transglycosylase MltG [Brevefilum sp.]